MRLKICGMTNAEDIRACAGYADALGFIVEYPESPRSVTVEEAMELMEVVPPFVTKVAVVPDFSRAEEICSVLKPNAVQLHGDESVGQVAQFCEHIKIQVIKACGAADAPVFARHADAVLIDDKYGEYTLDEVRKIIEECPRPVILAGGLAPENVLEVLAEVTPYGLDVASGVENEPGRKDPAKVRSFRKRMDLGRTVGGVVGSKMHVRSVKVAPGHTYAKAGGHTNRFFDSLSREGLSIITEIKPSSPSEGELCGLDDLQGIVRSMESGGASAVSVLVEEQLFGGSLGLLKEVRSLTGLPLLAKGFLLNDRDISDAARAGANAVLLMNRVLDAEGVGLGDMLGHAASLKLDAVVEVATAEELASSLEAGARIIQVNNRDIYGDLGIDLANAALGRELPEGLIFISASGIEGPDDIAKIRDSSGSRADALLVGTSIMRSADIEAKVRELVVAAREVAA